MTAEAASPQPVQKAGTGGTDAVTMSRAVTVTVFGVLATMMSAFDSVSRNLALPFVTLIGAGHFAITAILAGSVAFCGGIALWFGKAHAVGAELEELAV